ncbi:MAG: glycosyltransferase family 4 protein [Thermoplasmata archaeon]|nr:MAG: glycosyltransferase family 4 protein [Thermoplasmata archaeon]
MRICFVTPYSPKVVGGVGTFIRELCQRLKKRGIDYVILTKDYDKNNNSTEQIIEIPISDLRYVRSLIFTLKMILFIFKNSRQIDVLHLQTSNHLLAPIVIIGKILRIPILTTIHGKIPYGKSFPLKQVTIIGEWVILTFSDQIVYVSEDTYKYYKKRGLVIQNGVNIAKYYLDKEQRKRMRLKYNVENSFIILFVGRLTFTKGIYELLEALSKLKKSESINFRLVNVGLVKDQDIDSYLEAVERLDLKQNIINVQQQNDISGFYNMGDVFILPTYTEGLPYALLEAMASEMVVIASDVGDISAVIENGQNGFLIKPRNVEDILEKLVWCINNQEASKILGKNARNTVESNFNFDQMVESYLNVYKSCIQKK